MSTRLQIAALVFVMTNAVAFGILTAEMDDHSFAWLDGLRRRHFPQERNFLPAQVATCAGDGR